MRSTKDGVTYDTDAARLVAAWSIGSMDGAMYCDDNGRYFTTLQFDGHTVLAPKTTDEAHIIAAAYAPRVAEEEFCDDVKMASLNLMVSERARGLIYGEAAERGMSVREVIERLAETLE